jgi:hypothetical protein
VKREGDAVDDKKPAKKAAKVNHNPTRMPLRKPAEDYNNRPALSANCDHLAQGKQTLVDDIDDDAPLIAAVAAQPTLSRDEKAIKLHSEKLQTIRTALKGVYTGTIKIVLEHNGLRSNGGDITLQHRLADVMLHGVPEPCPKVYAPPSLSPSLCLSALPSLSACIHAHIPLSLNLTAYFGEIAKAFPQRQKQPITDY